MTSKKGLDVLVVGGGIAGLSAAIALRRAGHNVKILERSSYAQEVGAAITVPPNASRILRRWGMDFGKARMNPYSGLYLFTADGTALEEAIHTDFSHMEDSFGAPYLLSHRVDLHDGLRELALGKGGGFPVEIINNCRVSKFSLEEGMVHISSSPQGATLKADLIVASDGVHSKGSEVLGFDSPALPSSTTVIRFLIATKELLSDPVTASLLKHGSDQGSMYVSSDKTRWLFRYPCRNNTLQNFGLYTTNPDDGNKLQETRRVDCDRSTLLHAMRGFHPSLIAICYNTAEILPLWTCTERAPLPKYTQQKFVVVGDAAHAMLPHIGQGAAQAIEDAAALEVLFKDVRREHDIARRMQIYDQVRRDRATAAQILSHVMVWEQGNGGIEQLFRDTVPTIKIPGTKSERHKFLYGHDVTKECEKYLRNHQKTFEVR